jgi:hypothetical protein
VVDQRPPRLRRREPQPGPLRRKHADAGYPCRLIDDTAGKARAREAVQIDEWPAVPVAVLGVAERAPARKRKPEPTRRLDSLATCAPRHRRELSSVAGAGLRDL